MKVLILIIFSETEIYNDMLKLQKKYINQHKNIDAYFVAFNKEQDDDITLIDNIIYVKGSESYTNILYKTLKGLEYIHNNISNSYDFVVRSNISTLINLNNLYNFLSSIRNKSIYTGGTLETLKHTLQPYEISEHKQSKRNNYYGLKYIQGTSIIMSYDIVNYLIRIINQIDYDIVDDVKLGIIIKNNLPKIYNNIEKNRRAKVTYNTYEPNSIFIRNRTHERTDDIRVMKNIIHTHLIFS